MTTYDVLNTTIFNSDDVIKIVTAVTEHRHKEWKEIRIRYMVKPYRCHVGAGKYDDRWARVNGIYSEKLEIGLLKPQKWGDNILQVLANQEEEFAHARLGEDLAHVTRKTCYSKVELSDTRIRMNDEEDEAPKLISAYRSAVHQLRLRSADVKSAKNRIPELREELERLEAWLPKAEAHVQDLKKKLAKREAVMRSKGIDYTSR